jgi:molybdopterin-guanine dinucleotide biosynthesis protein A
MITDIPCVILAGGRSSRMGEDKSLLPFGGYSTLIEYQYQKLIKIFSNVYISSKVDKFDFLLDKTKIIYDTNDNISSPMLALKSIFSTLNYQKIFIITVDTPLIKLDTIYQLNTLSLDYDICIAKTATKIHNLCGVFNKNIYGLIDNYVKEDIHKINFLIRNVNTKYSLFNDEDEFINLNTLEDYEVSLSLSKEINNSSK